MKLFLVTCLVACAAADVSHILDKDHKESSAGIVKQSLDVSADGSYQWSFETDNGISAGATGEVTDLGPEKATQVVQGEAKWISSEGEPVSLTYIADENGYQPQGSHIPTPPPIPEAILRALEYIRAHPAPPEKN